MSTLRSALDELRSEDLRFASDDELADDLGELERATRVLEAERARRLAEVDHRGLWSLDGHLSLVSWLAARLCVGFARASLQVRVARALKEMPATAEALGEGELSSEAVTLLVSARDVAPDAFQEAELMLVKAAANLTPRNFRHAIDYWRQAADSAAAEERARRSHDLRHLHVSPTLEGMVRVDGNLDPECGQTLITAIRSVQDAWVRVGADDLRTAPQRRADALGELCRRWLDSSDRAEVAGERPHVTVTVDLESLEGRLGHICELEDTGPIAPEAARRLACDASVSRVITRGRSEPLDVGRRTAVVPAGLRRALAVRDGGCRFPGCGDRRHGATVITSGTGWTEVRRRSRISFSCAGRITARCTTASASSSSRDEPRSSGMTGARWRIGRRRRKSCYFEAVSDSPTAAWPAARRAVSIRNGEQLT